MREVKLGKSNPIIKDLKKKIRNNSDKNYFIIDDLSIIEIVKNKPNKIEQLFYCEELITKAETKETLNVIKERCDKVYSISKDTFISLSSKNNSAGILITMSHIEISKNSFKIDNYKRILITDKIEIPGNLGTIYRTADATGFDLIINVDSITSINHPKCIHSSRGTIFTVPTFSCSYKFVQKLLLENEMLPILGEPNEGESCFDFKFPSKLAIVVGNERYGINNMWYENPHQKIYIPMHGIMKSLNVGVATSILMYQVAKKDFKIKKD